MKSASHVMRQGYQHIRAYTMICKLRSILCIKLQQLRKHYLLVPIIIVGCCDYVENFKIV